MKRTPQSSSPVGPSAGQAKTEEAVVVPPETPTVAVDFGNTPAVLVPNNFIFTSLSHWAFHLAFIPLTCGNSNQGSNSTSEVADRLKAHWIQHNIIGIEGSPAEAKPKDLKLRAGQTNGHLRYRDINFAEALALRRTKYAFTKSAAVVAGCAITAQIPSQVC